MSGSSQSVAYREPCFGVIAVLGAGADTVSEIGSPASGLLMYAGIGPPRARQSTKEFICWWGARAPRASGSRQSPGPRG